MWRARSLIYYIGNKYLGDSDRASRLYFNKRLAEYGLTGSKFIFFMAICRMPGITKADLTKLTLFDKGLVSIEVSHLTKMGLVMQTKDPIDSRAHNLFPTEKGKEIYRAADDVITSWNKRLYEKVGGDEEKLEGLLYRISQASREILREDYDLEYMDMEFNKNNE